MKQRLLFSIILAFVAQGCIQTIAVRSMSGIFQHGIATYMEESDLQLAHESLGSTLKLIETLIKADPQNTELLTYAAQGYQAYGLAFCEDIDNERARVFYLRGKEYGLRALKKNKRFAEALDGSLEQFRAAVQTFSPNDLPAVFWTAFNWGSYINISRTDVTALADIPKVLELISFVLQHDSSYYYGAAYIFLGSLEATTPRMLGGNPEKAREYFEKALTINKGSFLLTHVFYAKSYAVQEQQKELFDALLKTVEDTPLDVAPEIRLPNAVAKEKAKRLREQENDFFEEG